jgi:hypothetical protein
VQSSSQKRELDVDVVIVVMVIAGVVAVARKTVDWTTTLDVPVYVMSFLETDLEVVTGRWILSINLPFDLRPTVFFGRKFGIHVLLHI